MDTKKLLNALSDKLVLPIFMVVIVGLSYLAFSANSKAKSAQSKLVSLVLKLQERDLDQSFSGTRIPNALLDQITSKLKAEEKAEVKYWVLQFISMRTCTPCAQKDIDLFGKISALYQSKVKFFFVVDDTSYREVNSLKHSYRINFPINFVFDQPTDSDLFNKSVTLLTTNQGIILLRYSAQPEDTLRNTLNSKILQQFVSN